MADQLNLSQALSAIETPSAAEASKKSEAGNALNVAEIHSKPMSVLDELDVFWEKNDASKG